MKTAVFFILARMESTAVLYFLRKGVKLHFYSLGTIFEENMWGIQRGIAPRLWVSNRGESIPVGTRFCSAKSSVLYLLRSETGKHEDFAQQREVFFNMYGNRNIQIVMTINSVGKKLYEPEDTIGLGTIRRHAVWEDYEVLFVPSINAFGKTPVEITAEIMFLESNGVRVYSISEGIISSKDLPLLFRKQFRIVK